MKAGEEWMRKREAKITKCKLESEKKYEKKGKGKKEGEEAIRKKKLKMEKNDAGKEVKEGDERT